MPSAEQAVSNWPGNYLMARRQALVGVVLAVAASITSPAAGRSAAEVYEIAAPSLVVVEAYDEDANFNEGQLRVTREGSPKGQGSGVILSRGVVLSNCHVLTVGVSWVIKHEGKTYEKGTMKFMDPERDLCTLDVPDLSGPPVRLRKSSVRVGETVYSLGAPKGLELTLAQGLVSALRAEEGGKVIQTSAAISHGSSGGGLFDEDGYLVGITTSKMVGGEGLNFAMPAHWANELPQRSKRYRERSEALSKQYRVTCYRAMAHQLSDAEVEKYRADARIWTEQDPYSYFAWRCLGFASKSDYQSAVEAFERSLELRVDTDTLLNLGVVHMMRGISVRLNSQDMDSETSQRVGDIAAEAEEAFQRVLEMDSRNTAAWIHLSQLYQTSARPRAAVVAARKATEVEQGSAMAWNALASAELDMGNGSEALAAARRAVSLEDSIANWLVLKSAAEAVGDTMLARRADDRVREGVRKLSRP